MRPLLLPALTALLAATGIDAAQATPPLVEDLDSLDIRLAVALGGTAADVGRLAQPIDRRLRLLRCEEGAVFEPPAMGTIAVTCRSRGWRLRVRLIEAAAAESAEIVIRRGDAVEFAYTGAGFDVTTAAIALEDGHTGGMVRVKTPTGAASVSARVAGPGSVAIGD